VARVLVRGYGGNAWGSGKLGNACPLPGELITVVESAYKQMALPEYPLWCDRSIVVRWFSAPGKLLRMDGRGSYCWLFARGRTPADLGSICATIPGPWVSAQGTREISDLPHDHLCEQAQPPTARLAPVRRRNPSRRPYLTINETRSAGPEG